MRFYPGNLALGGGGLKGAAHIGVLQVFEEEGFPIETITGTSAGSVVGAAYAMGYSIENLIEIMRELAKGKTLDFSIHPTTTLGIVVRLILNMLKWGKHDTQLGLIRGKQLEDFLQMLFASQTFEELRYPFMVTAVDLRSGRSIIFTSKAMARKLRGVQNGTVYTDVMLKTAVRASTAIPGIFTPLYYRDMILVDGGIKNMVPVDLLHQIGARRIIGVDLDSGEQAGEQLNDVLAVLLQTVDIMTEEMKKLNLERYADLVLQPSQRGISLTDFAQLEQIYHYGYQLTKKNLPALRALLEKTYFRG